MTFRIDAFGVPYFSIWQYATLRVDLSNEDLSAVKSG